MLKIGVLVSGSGTTLQTIIDNIKLGIVHAEIVAVVSSKKSAYALTRAKENNIPTKVISNKNCENSDVLGTSLIEYFSSYNAELIICAGYLCMLPMNFINAYSWKIMNIHPSLIPSFCGEGHYGLAVHKAVIDYGAKITGATVHFVDEQYDTGPIIIQKAVNVYDDDTPELLQLRVSELAERVIYTEAIKLFSENKLNVDGRRVIIRQEG